MFRYFVLAMLPVIAGCGGNTNYVVPADHPSARLVIDHEEDQIWSRNPYNLYLLEVGDGCLMKSRIPVSSAKEAALRNRTSRIPSGTEVTFLLEHDSPFSNAYHECNIMFAADITADETYRLAFHHPRFDICDVRVERETGEGNREVQPVDLVFSESVDEDKLPVCPN